MIGMKVRATVIPYLFVDLIRIPSTDRKTRNIAGHFLLLNPNKSELSDDNSSGLGSLVAFWHEDILWK